MGKASKWFRGLLGLNRKPDPNLNHKPTKKKWGFVKPKYQHPNAAPQNDVAVAAFEAVQAAAEVVGLSSRRATANVNRNGAHFQDWAIIKIQSHFRAYLARRALRALKALVKIQALVRGYIVRKRTSDSMRRVQALIRLQARARLRRSQILEYPYSPLKNTQFKSGSRSNGKNTPADDEKYAKVLEVDPGTNDIPKRRNLFHSSHLSLSSDNYSHTSTTTKDSAAHQAVPSPSSEVQSSCRQRHAQDLRDACYYKGDHISQQVYPASSKGGGYSHRGNVTPTQSDGSKGSINGYSSSPSYMSYTESSKAKIRSVSAPRQRPQFERSNSSKRYSVHSSNDTRFNPLGVSGLQTNFANKAYPGSGCLDRLGMPIGGDADVYCGGHWRRV